MSEPADPLPDAFHAHVYYTPETRTEAEALRGQLGDKYDFELGRLRDEPVGPHPVPMFYMEFPREALGEVITFLLWNRGDLRILVHPFTPHHERDHSERAIWLGDPVTLRMDVFAKLSARGTD